MHYSKTEDLVKLINRMANSEDLDETAHYELSHPDLHCLHSYLYRSTVLKRLTNEDLD